MDQGLKERLIGAAVLVALAVWLIPWVLDGPDQPIPEDAEPLRLPVPSGHVGEVRTEVIDLSQRRQGDDGNPGASSEPRPGAGVERRAEPATASVTARAAESGSAPSSSPASDSGVEAAAASAAPARSSAAPEPDETVAKAESPTTGPIPASPTSSSSGGDRPATASTTSSDASRTAPAPSGDWAVQLGSFGDEDNARRLADRVAALGHSPRIMPYRTGGRTMYRVRIGPHPTREAAEAAASALAARGFPAQVVTVE